MTLNGGDLVMPLEEDLTNCNIFTITGPEDVEIVSNGGSPLQASQSLEICQPDWRMDWNSAKKLKRKRSPTLSDETPVKKRLVKPAKWKKVEAKLAYNSGVAHVSLRGINREARKVKDGCDSSKCRQGCHSKISSDDRQAAAEMYWGQKDKTMQWYLINKYVTKKDVKQRKALIIEDESPVRSFTFVYSVPVNVRDDPNLIKYVPVCKKMFLDTFDISATVVRTALTKNSPDKRGKHTNGRRRLPLELIDSVKTHIKDFPLMESHYCRKDSRKMYLDEHLNVAKMHRMYLTLRGLLPNTANERQYRDIFNTCFNLSFFQPKKDKCAFCAEWIALSQEMKVMKEKQHEEHVRCKETVRKLRREDKILSRSEETKENGLNLKVITFDMQKVLYVPKCDVGEFFYRRKLSNYNFTIFDCTNKQATNYFWEQTTGKRGSDEMSSYVQNYIEDPVNKEVTEFHIYSDSCFGQNKNQFLFSMYYLIAMKHHLKIVHRYLEKGHTQMEVDSVHARIENKTRKLDIFVPTQWLGYIKSAKVKSPTYQVKHVKQEMIFSYKDLARHFNWSKIPISKLREITFDSTNPGRIMYKLDFDGPEISVDILNKKTGRPVSWSTFKPPLAYSGKLSIKKKVINDLQWYLQKNLIPAPYREYYENLMADVEGPLDDEGDVDTPVEINSGEDICDNSEDEANEEINEDLEGNGIIDYDEEGASTDSETYD